MNKKAAAVIPIAVILSLTYNVKSSNEITTEKIDLAHKCIRYKSMQLAKDVRHSQNRLASRSTSMIVYKMNVSAYTLREQECGKSEDDANYGITASGEQVKEWYTVAAPKSIPFGTKLYIPYFANSPNKGIFVVQDRGGAIKEGHLDIYMRNLQDALNFGRRYLEVYVIK
jgi:3D (Asp-Asp-Asp) domain-containing protein